MLGSAIESEFVSLLPKGIRNLVQCGFLFGSLAKGHFKPHHDIDVFLIFNEKPSAATLLDAQSRYYEMHKRFGATPDVQFPGEYYSRHQIDTYLNEPIDTNMDWRMYSQSFLDRLFVLEVLAGSKVAIFGNEAYLSSAQELSFRLVKTWRAGINVQISLMSDHELMKDIIFQRY